MQSEEHNELAELAGSFIHEIKNHLGTLGLNLQLLAEDFQNAETQREKRALQRAHRLQQECEHLVDLSNDFLRFARLNDLTKTPCDLSVLIEELVDFFLPTAKQTQIEITTHLPTGLPAVALDPELFKQCLLNLFLNAQQAMPDGGEITIQTVIDRSGDRERIALNVIDTGEGIKPGTLAKIFKPFYSTRKQGTGLGLATTRRIIEAHEGSIEAQSEPGQGTRFVIHLPTLTARSEREEDRVASVGKCER